MEDDLELKLLTQRRLAELRKKAAAEKPPAPKEEKSAREIALGVLYDRGDEVLDAAYRSYPRETELIVAQMARLVREGKLTDKISGGELLSIFRSIGMRVSVNTSIKVQQRGKLVDLAEKLRSKKEEGGDQP